MNVDWIARVLSLGSKDEDGVVQRRALAIFAAVQGAQLVARSRGDAAVYDEVVQTYRESGFLP
jgi:TetR/AcrR family transcriptional repressor of nem operon